MTPPTITVLKGEIYRVSKRRLTARRLEPANAVWFDLRKRR